MSLVVEAVLCSELVGGGPRERIQSLGCGWDGPMEVGVSSVNSVIERVDHCSSRTDGVGVLKALGWAHDSRDGERLPFSSLHHGILLFPLEKSLGEGSRMGQELQIVQATLSEGFDSGKSMVSYCSDKELSSSEMVLYHEEGIRDSESLLVHPLAVVKEPASPESVTSDWVVQSVTSFCHVVRLSCEGFEGMS